MKKKVIAIILALAMVLTLAGCGGSGSGSGDGDTYGSTGIQTFSRYNAIYKGKTSDVDVPQIFKNAGTGDVYSATPANLLSYALYLLVDNCTEGEDQQVTYNTNKTATYNVITSKNNQKITMVLLDTGSIGEDSSKNTTVIVYVGDVSAKLTNQ